MASETLKKAGKMLARPAVMGSNALQAVLRKYVPAIRKEDTKMRENMTKADYYKNVGDSVVELRGLRQKMLPPGVEKKTPKEYNEIMGSFNENPRVRKLKDTVSTYKKNQRMTK